MKTYAAVAVWFLACVWGAYAESAATGEAEGADAPQAARPERLDAASLEARMTAADTLRADGRLGRAYAEYVRCLDATEGALAVEVAERVRRAVKETADPAKEEWATLEAQLPAWETLRTARAKSWLIRFQESRAGAMAAAGDAVQAKAAAQSARDMAWALVVEHPDDLETRFALRIYYDMSKNLGDEAAARQALAEHAVKLEPCVAAFCITYWAAQHAAEDGDVSALAEHCRALLEIYEKGVLTEALDSLQGDPTDKLLIEYHIAYACFVLGRYEQALAQCDRTLATYGDVRDRKEREHGALLKTRVLRAMSIAGLDTTGPEKGAAAFEAFIDAYPDDPNSAAAWLNKGMHYERFEDRTRALECYERASTGFPATEEGTQAAARAQALRQADGP